MGQPSTVISTRAKVDSLESDRKKVLDNIHALNDILASHNADMETPLLTPEGYPRSDIDVVQIRTARAQIIRLRNDFKQIQEDLYKVLEDHYAEMRRSASTGSAPGTSAAATAAAAPSVAFAYIDSLASGGPAESAGLAVNDRIVKFGPYDAGNFGRLANIGQLVQSNQGNNIHVLVSRPSSEGEITIHADLRPSKGWGGPGLLGCHLVPL